MTATTSQPLSIYQIDHGSWENLTCNQQEQIRRWAATEGIDLSDVTRLEIHVIDCPLARITAHARDEAGDLILDDARTTIVQGPPRDVLIHSMPPVPPATTTGEAQ